MTEMKKFNPAESAVVSAEDIIVSPSGSVVADAIASAEAKAAELKKASEPVFKAPEALPVSHKVMTYAEYLDLEVAIPVFQRPAVWSDDWKKALRDSIFHGYPLPELIVVVVRKKDGSELALLIDGVQRTTAIDSIMHDLEAERKAAPSWAEAAVEYLLEYPISVMRVTAPDMHTAAELFVRYNSGNKLNGAQKGKAQLPPEIISACAPYEEIVKLSGLNKFKSITADTMAVIMAAAMTCAYTKELKFKAVSSGTAAINQLKKTAPVNPSKLVAIRSIFTALRVLDEGQRSKWAVASTLVPLCVAAEQKYPDLTTAQAQEFLETANTNSNVQVTAWFLKGKTAVSDRKSISTHLNGTSGKGGATGSSAKHVAIRTAVYGKLLDLYMTGTKIDEDTEKNKAQAEAVAQAEAMLENL